MPKYRLNVNGETRTVDVRDSGEPLLYVLRNALGLTGAKYGCGLGQCGSCTVIVDGEAVRTSRRWAQARRRPRRCPRCSRTPSSAPPARG